MLIQAPFELAALPAGPKAAIAPKLLAGTADFSALLEASVSGASKPLIAPEPSDDPVLENPEEADQAPVEAPGKGAPAMPETGKVLPPELGVSTPHQSIPPKVENGPNGVVKLAQSPPRTDALASASLDAPDAKLPQALAAPILPKTAPAAVQSLPVSQPATARVEVAAHDDPGMPPRTTELRAAAQAGRDARSKPTPTSDLPKPEVAAPTTQEQVSKDAEPVAKVALAAAAHPLNRELRSTVRNLRNNTPLPSVADARAFAPNMGDLANLIEQPASKPKTVQTHSPQEIPEMLRGAGLAERPATPVAPSTTPSVSGPEPDQPTQSHSQPSTAASSNAQPQALQTSAPIVQAAPPVVEARFENRISPQVEAAIDHMVEAREAGRTSRPELTLRHAEFGAVNVRLEAVGTDMRATLASRDPAFVPAIQAALAERGVVASSETSASNSQRSHDQNSNPSHSNTQFSGGNANSEGRYGSSTGSGQAQSQPYSEHNGSDDEELASHDRSEPAKSASESSSAAGLFA